MRFVVGISEIAHRGVFGLFLGERGKGVRHAVAVLNFQPRKINSLAREPRGRARLEPAHGKAERFERIGEIVAARKAYGSALLHRAAANNRAVQIHARRHDHRAARVHAARDAFDCKILAVLCYGFYLVLTQRQVVRLLQSGFGKRVILVLILLRAQAAHRQALGRIEHADLRRALVRGNAHKPAERVQLAHEMPLARAAYRRIARHITDVIDGYGRDERLYARLGERER